MKPEGAEELAVQADLAECSYEEASDLIRMGLGIGYCKKVLSVSLWDIDTAIHIMAKFRDCDIMARQDFAVDEWMVSASWVNDQKYTVWSGGA